MKIKGKTKFEVPRKVVRLMRTTSGEDGTERVEELSIRVRALPVGNEQKMFELFPEPVKSQDWAKDAKGVVIRDPETKKPQVIDVETPEWRESNKRSFQGRMAYILYHGIDDPEVELPVRGAQDSPEFYTAFFAELVEFGFTMGDLGRLMGEITDLMNLSEDVEKARSS